jgi:hypothetical protein
MRLFFTPQDGTMAGIPGVAQQWLLTRRVVAESLVKDALFGYCFIE